MSARHTEQRLQGVKLHLPSTAAVTSTAPMAPVEAGEGPLQTYQSAGSVRSQKRLESAAQWVLLRQVGFHLVAAAGQKMNRNHRRQGYRVAQRILP